MTALCNLNGTITQESEARVPVLDRGFLFGDSIYEVVRTRHGKLFAWQEHLDRLRVSASAIRLELDLSDEEIMRRIVQTVDATGNDDCYVRIVVTRGTGSAPNIDLGTATGTPCWVIMARPLPVPPPTAKLAIVERLRNDRRALDPATKSGNYLNNVLGLAEAKAAGATDCAFLNTGGLVTEASTSNLFLRAAGEVLTPPLEAGILAGITRAHVLEVLRARGDKVSERQVTRDELVAADEVWLTSSLRDVAPVTELDGRALTTHPFAEALAADYRKWADERAVSDDKLARELAAT